MSTQYDLIVRGGTVVDGTGAEPVVADVALAGRADRGGRERLGRCRGRRSTPAGCW